MIRGVAQGCGFALVRARSRPVEGHVDLLDRYSGFSCLTSVVRLPTQLSARAAAMVRALPGSGRQYVYPSSDLHLTIAKLDRSRLSADDLVTVCDTVGSRAAPFPIELRGLAMTAQSVYLQAWDPTGSLWRLRKLVADAAGVDVDLPKRLLGFVNVVRFSDPHIDDLRRAVRRHRARSVGAFTVRDFEVVRTDKVLSARATQILGPVALRRDGEREERIS